MEISNKMMGPADSAFLRDKLKILTTLHNKIVIVCNNIFWSKINIEGNKEAEGTNSQILNTYEVALQQQNAFKLTDAL